ncbi:T9SS type A sorting domain-containing protein [Algibacter pectinivorans]|uniref:Por secretion system C-terminal sorting domain-containing protein n=1 Tax=Algibacter pectinivorans TaxID=870482 RepID=A0A1I1R584_9FLAO|nr:T9SS type A sorting domain-containing protein [Algibacter pectinivorans]SFD27308.1 Por secretion system C-terminal sorting domain-containing protein [Algibacter pectinivorans]
MKKNTLKSFLFCTVTLFTLFVSGQSTAPDEDTNPDISCPASDEFKNPNRSAPDLPNAVNVGTIDDRTCYSNYTESNVYGKTWGVYNITDGSNHFGERLQPRMERSLSRSRETGIGSFAKFTGVFRILEVGDAGSFGQDGSYIAQAKGKHTGGGGSPDPAICLYLAKPVYGTGADSDKQVSFDIYAERILYRGGEGSGREVVFLKNVSKNVETNFELEVGFGEDPSDATKKIHYCNAIIGGDVFNWNIPEPEKGTESGIRYGAYRVKGGRAQIRWANTAYQKEEVVNIDNGNPGPTDDVFRLRNVATGQFLTDSGASAVPVTMTNSGEEQNTHWAFVESGNYFNLDSETLGILRAPGAGGPGGAYVVVSTTKGAPATDGDKIWTIHYDEVNETYRFESGNSGRFMYHDTNGTVTHISVGDTDDRSVWEAIPTNVSLSLSENKLSSSEVKIFPNPANDSFTMAFKNLNQVKVQIFDMLGKTVYNNKSLGENLKVINNGQFKSGVYLIRVVDGANKVYNTKLIIK